MKLIYLIVVCLTCVCFAEAANLDGWVTMTSAQDVRQVTFFNDSIQVVSSGGWLKIDPDTDGKISLTNTDGLGTNDLHCIIRDDDNVVWLGGYGRLIRYRDGEYTPFLFFDRDNNLLTIYSIVDDGDYLWVGTSIGLALFSKLTYDGQIEDFYYRFGDLDPEPAVFDIELSGDSIWLATSSGLATADRSIPQLLKSFANWRSYGRLSHIELMVDYTGSVAIFHDTIFIGNSRNVFKLTIDGLDTTFISILGGDPVEINQLNVIDDSLFIYTDNGFYIYSDDGVETGSVSGIPTVSFASGYIVNGVHWIGTSGNGLYSGTGISYSEFDDGGLPGNYITTLASSANNQYAGGFFIDGVGFSNGQEWSKIDLGRNDWITSIVYDDYGGTWVGQWGNGLTLVTTGETINFDENNSSLRGVSEGPAYVVVNSMVLNGNYLFMTNYRALDGNPVSVVDITNPSNPLRWISFGVGDGIMTDRVISLDTYDDVFVVGTAGSGVYYYYFGPDPFNKADDSIVNMREDNRWLGSNEILKVHFDDAGGLRVGTTAGVSFYDIGIDRFLDVDLPLGFGPGIYNITSDSRGFVWLGAINGLGRQNPVTGDVEVFTILNSGLTNDRITALMADNNTGDLWVGTPAGLSIKKSEFGEITSDIENVIAFPNPYIIRDGSEQLRFNYDGNATVNIYTVNGELVKSIDINENWDGRNRQNKDVASGVYLFLLTGDDGAVGRGKVLLVRQ